MINITNKQKNIAILTSLVAVVLYSSFVVARRAIIRKKLNDQLVDMNVSFTQLFNKSLWENQQLTLSDPKLREMARTIYNSIGYFTDDRIAVAQQLQFLNTKGDASLLAYVYYNLYQRELSQDLEKMFSGNSADLALVSAKLNSLN